jgi:hypothetical protein
MWIYSAELAGGGGMTYSAETRREEHLGGTEVMCH